LEKLTSKQLSEWQAYDRLEPIDNQQRSDLRMGILASLIANLAANIYSKKNKKPKKFKPEDFMPKWNTSGRAKKQQSVEEMKSILMAFTKQGNKQDG
jgi:uncharacterized membrane protein